MSSLLSQFPAVQELSVSLSLPMAATISQDPRIDSAIIATIIIYLPEAALRILKRQYRQPGLILLPR